jgi:hypothetical protein
MVAKRRAQLFLRAVTIPRRCIIAAIDALGWDTDDIDSQLFWFEDNFRLAAAEPSWSLEAELEQAQVVFEAAGGNDFEAAELIDAITAILAIRECMTHGLDGPIRKTAKAAFSEDIDLDDWPILPNDIVVRARFPKQLGFFQGWEGREVNYLWVFSSPDEAARLKINLQNESGEIPLFDHRQIMGMSDAIDSVFVRKRKAAKGLIGAVRYLVFNEQVSPEYRDGQKIVYIDMMSVRTAWRRRGVNKAMIRTIANLAGPDYVIEFSSPTHLGKQFIDAWQLIPRSS